MQSVSNFFRSLLRWYRAQTRFVQIACAIVALALIGFLCTLGRGDTTPEALSEGRFVTLATVDELSGVSGGAPLVGTVRAATGADVLAKTGGTVVSVNTEIGKSVPAGFVIANLENAAERAAVLSAEGAYDAAVAARDAQSLGDTQQNARDAYQSAYTTLDTTVENQISVFFGAQTPYGPQFLLDSASFDERTQFAREWARIDANIDLFKSRQAQAANRTPAELLDDAEAVARELQTFLNTLADIVNERESSATDTQRTALTTARGAVNGVLAQISNARAGLRTGTIGATASADATVKQALGALRSAQANLERTIVRAPISGTVDFLPIRTGDYVSMLQHVATLSQNGALDIVAYAPESARDTLTLGASTTINDTSTGIITAVSPSLDPVTKQIEVRIAAESTSGLLNGQSVRVTLPLMEAATTTPSAVRFLPLASVKLRPNDRIVFSLDSENRLVAHPVEVGQVTGDRIEIRTDLPSDLRIVTDARGLAEGEEVRISEAQ
jgi:multidrug efflux pump subunit AcrA (membrane-fusion protein)